MSKIEGVLFDLDMTLVDTSRLQADREKGDWGRVYSLIPASTIYGGIKSQLSLLGAQLKCGVVTSSPREYARRLLDFHGLSIPIVAAYHDTISHKPKPDPILKGVQELGLTPDSVIYVGDQECDVNASLAAGVTSALAGWGTDKSLSEAFSKVDYFLETPSHLSIVVNAVPGNQLMAPLMPFDVSASYSFVESAHHVAYYRKTSASPDAISRFLLDFKGLKEPQTSRWCDIAVQAVGQLGKLDVVIRALGSGEIKSSGLTPLDRVCRQIETWCGIPYSSARLTKSRPTKSLKLLGKEKREAELVGVYTFDSRGLPEAPRILIVDDVITTGTTTRAISDAIKAVCPHARVSLLALTKTDGSAQNGHLNASFFLSTRNRFGRGVDIVSDKPEKAKTHRKRRRPPVHRTKTSGYPFSEVADRAEVAGSAVSRSEPEVVPSAPAVRAKTTRPAAKRASLSASGDGVYVLILIALLVLSATVVERLASRGVQFNEPAEDVSGVQVPSGGMGAAATPGESVEKPYVSTDGLESDPYIPNAVICLPEIGLRTQPSIDAPAFKTILKEKNHVQLLYFRKMNTGPDWVRVRTNDGRFGWLPSFAVDDRSKEK